MICVSVAEPTPDRCLEALGPLDFAEVRIDGMDVSVEDVRVIFSKPKKLIATFRPPVPALNVSQKSVDGKRREFLAAAIEAGAAYVDIELESDDHLKKEIMEKARSRHCLVIVSFHDFELTPDVQRLEQIVDRCFEEGADIAKIACKINDVTDNLKLLGLLAHASYNGKTVVIGMGTKGKVTRIAAPLLGSPFTYASISRGKETAEGQIEKGTLEKLLRMLNDE